MKPGGETDRKRKGRPEGARNRRYKLDAKADLICKLMSKDLSMNSIASRVGVSPTTLHRWLERNMPDLLPKTGSRHE